MIEEAARRGRMVTVYHNRRWDGDILTLRQLLRDIQTAGGRTQVRRFATPADIAALSENLVFNCTGLGSRQLFGDEELTPIRGREFPKFTAKRARIRVPLTLLYAFDTRFCQCAANRSQRKAQSGPGA